MVMKHAVMILLCLMFIQSIVSAQPVLPDISAVNDKGTVLVAWVCQYNSIKAIAVLRAADSSKEYSLIGYVTDLKKGTQTFKDADPLPGRNCYKLAIEFKTGLVWRSNQICLKADKYQLESDKLFNNQSDTIKSKLVQTKTRPAIQSANDHSIPPIPNKQVHGLTFDSTDNTNTFQKPKYLFKDPKTGHINMFLPEDIGAHHYAVKFFDLENHLITEVPRIKTTAAIIDKRNFQGKTTIRFILRKDGSVFEEGYLHL